MARPGTTGRLLAATAALALGLSLSVAPAASADPGHHATVVEVQTYNMDFGGDLSALFAPGADLIAATSLIWAETVASNIPERATAVADEIATRQPDLVGLQEVSTWRTAPATPTSPTTVAPTGPFVTDYDALASLLAALRGLGTPYRAVVVDTTFSNEAFPLPAVTATGLRLVAFTDYNVVLVREKSLRQGMRLTQPADAHLPRQPPGLRGRHGHRRHPWLGADRRQHRRAPVPLHRHPPRGVGRAADEGPDPQPAGAGDWHPSSRRRPSRSCSSVTSTPVPRCAPTSRAPTRSSTCSTRTWSPTGSSPAPASARSGRPSTRARRARRRAGPAGS